MKYYLAIDLGASSGRHILAHFEDEKIVLEEIHRFKNGFEEKNGSLCWDTARLFNEILIGMKKCAELNKIPESVAIDTWGVDFVLLDKNDNIVGDSVSYRDSRTNGMDSELCKIISEEELYARTGIQKQLFNTSYQLMSIKLNNPEYFKEAVTFLFIPEYLTFLLSGKKASEYTIASTSQLLNAENRDWDYELIEKMGIPKEIFCPIHRPGTVVGDLTPEVAKVVGYNAKVILTAAHDTASAIAALPTQQDNTLYISSGTWSLLGTESMYPICNKESMDANFTNEGGYDYRFRFLKNIMGLWMMQSVRKEWHEEVGFGEISNMARNESITSCVDPQNNVFFAPKSMINAIKDECRLTGQQVPETLGEIAKVIYNSLSKCYAQAIGQIEAITGINYPHIAIVGGGSQDSYLNKLTAKASGKKVSAGPTEATAMGNLIIQMMALGDIADLKSARKFVENSFDIKYFG
ncbi:MAG: rhamnulokinase [Acutalibacteraceae bacterium]|nr:rhamnulokinase [Acutalibacteraceae bacterium]